MGWKQGFVTGVIGHRIQGCVIDPSAVISVDDLTHQPKIRFQRLAVRCQRFLEFQVKHISNIQAQPIDIKPLDPPADSVQQVFSHPGMMGI